MTLYDITKDIEAIDELLSQEKELTIEEQQIIINYLNENDENLDTKLEGYVKYIRSLEAYEKSIKDEIDYLQKKKKVNSNKIDNIKKSLKYFLDMMNLKSRKAGVFELKIQKNPASLKIIGEVTNDYKIIKEEINNSLIKDDLKNGVVLDFAILEQSESLRTK